MKGGLVLIVAMLLLAPAGAAAATPVNEYYQLLRVKATWSVDGTRTITTAEEGTIVVNKLSSSAAYRGDWPGYPLSGGALDFDQPLRRAAGDGKPATCSEDDRSQRATTAGRLALSGRQGGLRASVTLNSPCQAAFGWLDDLHAPSHWDLTQDLPTGRSAHVVLDDSRTYSGRIESGEDETVTVKWHVEAWYATPCLSFAGRGGACSSRSSKALDSTRVCGLASRAQVATAVGSRPYVYSDHPNSYCFFRGSRGNLSIYRGFASAYRPETDYTSWGKLLAADGFGSTRVVRAGGGRVLQVLGDRPWVRDWYAYKGNEVLFFTFVKGPASMDSAILRLSGQMLARL